MTEKIEKKEVSEDELEEVQGGLSRDDYTVDGGQQTAGGVDVNDFGKADD
jgi:bacteriocin-like protein